MSQVILSLKEVAIKQSGTTVLSDINLDVALGEFIYFIGKTGSGKSSIMKLLYGELSPSSGQATIVDYNLKKLQEKDIPFLRRKIGIVFQDFKLLSDRSIKSNLEFVLKATGWEKQTEINGKIDEVLSRVGLENVHNKMPHQLSGGEQQRVAIARALLNDPEIILADEPTGNLDPQTSIEIMEVLRAINANGKTVIMATHDYALLVKFPSKTLKFEDGKVYEVVQKAV
jgi:cell division transport system ATP-binding protein